MKYRIKEKYSKDAEEIRFYPQKRIFFLWFTLCEWFAGSYFPLSYSVIEKAKGEIDARIEEDKKEKVEKLAKKQKAAEIKKIKTKIHKYP